MQVLTSWTFSKFHSGAILLASGPAFLISLESVWDTHLISPRCLTSVGPDKLEMQAEEWKYRRKEDKDGDAKREEKRKTIRGYGEELHAKVGVTEEDGRARSKTNHL